MAAGGSVPYSLVFSGVPNAKWWNEVAVQYLESERKNGGPIASEKYNEKNKSAEVIFEDDNSRFFLITLTIERRYRLS